MLLSRLEVKMLEYLNNMIPILLDFKKKLVLVNVYKEKDITCMYKISV